MEPIISTAAIPTPQGPAVLWRVCWGDVCLEGAILAALLDQVASWSHQPDPGPSTIHLAPQLPSE